MKFFKYVLASLLALVLFCTIGMFIMFGMIGAAISDGEQTQALIGKHVLELKLDRPIQEQAEESPFEALEIPGLTDNLPIGLNQILNVISSAKDDANIQGIYLNIDGFSAGAATLTEIRNALEDFKSSGKKVFAYAEVFSQKAYYLASVADHISLHPEGGMELKGLATQIMFYKDFMKKLGVQPQVIRHGKFKSAVEPFMLDEMSEANLKQTSKLLDSVWESFAKHISKSRQISETDLNTLVEDFVIQSPEDAKKHKLVDALFYKHEFEKLLETELDDNDVAFVKQGEYYKSLKPKFTKDKIAIIYAEGQIISGKSKKGSMGDQTIVKAIRKAKKNDHVKAVVLRINSPGGSALASDVMWKELQLLKEEKPLVISMGDLAASGGYYIACLGDKIFAQENTITGSIGVFGLMFEMEELIKDKLELHIDQYKTHQYADMGTMTRPLSTDERDIIQNSVKRVYGTFTKHVSEGRGISVDSVDAIGQGRVWAGTDALNIGLVDEIGGLPDALAEAANLASLDMYSIKEYPQSEDDFASMLSGLSGVLISESSIQSNPWVKKWIESMSTLTQDDKIQARLPFEMEIY